MAIQSQPSLLPLLLLLRNISLLLLLLTTAAAASIITPGSTLYASSDNNTSTNQTWSSPNSTFFLGFLPIKPLTSPSTFLFSIFYSGGIPIWSPSTVPVDSGASFHFLPTGTLRLLNGSGHTIWDSATVNLGISSASLDDSGNLVLRNGTLPIWSSFDNPTDTVVPSQVFTTAKVLQHGWYSFNLLSFGNFTLKWNNSIVYWSNGLNSSYQTNLTSPSLQLQSVGSLSVFDPTLPSGVVMAYTSDYAEGSDVLRFLRLDSDGNLRIYSSVRGSGSETVRWVAVVNQCKVFGYCGNMGICSYNDSKPICGCPSQNFKLVDPMETRNGCKRKVETDECPGNNVTMLEMQHTKLMTYPPQSIFAIDGSEVFFVAISGCRSNCLTNPTCDASTVLSDGTGQCYYKTPGFISGYRNPALPSTSYVKVCSPAMDSNPSLPANIDGLRLHAWEAGVTVMGILLGIVALEGSLWWWCSRNRSKLRGLSAEYALLQYASGAPLQFSYKELRNSTKGFEERLGTGGIGTVYRGTLANKTVVAVKQLEEIEQGEKQFRMQVATISSTHHLNLVRLIGFCSEKRHRLLVYEFVKNGSLDNFLFVAKDRSGKLLDWNCRFNIALGTARGMTYLHEECRDCIVHSDIKPENILLDENFTAKVSDFGLAEMNTSTVRGTRGYLAPEWLQNLPLTSKSDVYSYGMVLLEIVSGKRNFEVSAETNWKKCSTWAYEEFEKGNVKGIVDTRLSEQEVDMEQVERAVQVSFWCIQEQASQRPKMGKVVQMLEGIIKIERLPALKAMTEGRPICAASGQAPSSSSSSSSFSSFQTAGFLRFASERNMERASSSLLRSNSN